MFAIDVYMIHKKIKRTKYNSYFTKEKNK